MDFSKLESLTIPEGKVKSLSRDGVLTWSKSENTDIPSTAPLAIFDFGPNGNQVHVDGTITSETKTYLSTSGEYSLNLTDMSKVYFSSYDTYGNSCLRVGTTRVVGTLTFVVPQEVNSVSIYIAKYKTNYSKITVNGGDEIVLTKNSTNGEYDKIDIDTSVEKSVTISTTTDAKCAMLNTIEFYA